MFLLNRESFLLPYAMCVEVNEPLKIKYSNQYLTFIEISDAIFYTLIFLYCW